MRKINQYENRERMVSMGLFKRYFNQTRKPEGFLGKMMIRRMNRGHARMAEWGMEYLKGLMPCEIMELGCGGGKNAGELLQLFPEAKVTALDYSPLSVEQAREHNRDAITAGRCVVMEGEVSTLAFDAERFDLVTAFETIYFWPGLEHCFAQVVKTLRPGGCFLIVNESDGTDETSLRFEQIIDGMRNYTVEQINEALKAAGFVEIRTDHHPEKPWIAVLARK